MAIDWGKIAQVGIPLLTGALGGSAAGKDYGNASAQYQANLDMWNALTLPTEEQMRLELQGPANVYDYTPEQLVAQKLAERDAMQDIALDPRLKQQQVKALDVFNQLAQSGFTPEQQVAMDAERRRTEADLTSNLKAIQARQDARGMGSADFALAQQLAEAQSSANRQAQDTAAMRAQASRNAMDAIVQGANLAGNMEQADYGRQADLARALNTREGRNVDIENLTRKSNVDAFNDYLRASAANRQNVENLGTQYKNTARVSNADIAERRFDMGVRRATGASGARGAIATDATNRGNRTTDRFTGIADSLVKYFPTDTGGTAASTAANTATFNKLAKLNPSTGQYE
jgi:hypothetical protein